MLSFLDPLRIMEAGGLLWWSVLLRMTVAIVCGGLIGIEREHKRRPAGFRTHVLICLGAAATTMTSQFMYLNLGMYTDMARLGAQVIAGIGFIGAGTIMVTKQRQVRGLTTAAGLWTSAIVGLAAGAGYYEAAVIVTVIILLVELLFSKLEYFLLANSKSVNVCVEYNDPNCLDAVLRILRATDVVIMDLEVAKNGAKTPGNSLAIFALQVDRRIDREELLAEIGQTEGIFTAEIL